MGFAFSLLLFSSWTIYSSKISLSAHDTAQPLFHFTCKLSVEIILIFSRLDFFRSSL